jgi:hypothetical protein
VSKSRRPGRAKHHTQRLDLAHVVTGDVFLAEPAEPADWGPWQLDGDDLVHLTSPLDRQDGYAIDLTTCTTAGEVLDWILQVGKKPWADGPVMVGLTRALNDLIDPQRHLCTGGANTQQLTPAAIRNLVRAHPRNTP